MRTWSKHSRRWSTQEKRGKVKEESNDQMLEIGLGLLSSFLFFDFPLPLNHSADLEPAQKPLHYKA
jgi:hypothetical protein